MGINQAVSERRAALAAAQELIAKAQAASNSADYADEIDTLDQVITNAAKGDADALTSDIIASTKLLDDAVNADMNSALAALAQDSSPVSNEADVIAAKATLQNSVDSNSATLVADTNNYLSVLAAAKITRSDAQTAAQDAMDRTVPNNKAAIIKAQGLLEQAMADANNELLVTSELVTLTDKLNLIIDSFVKLNEIYMKAVSGPVTYEEGIVPLVSNINDQFSNAQLTSEDVDAFTTQLQTIFDAAMNARDNAKIDATNAISNAKDVATNSNVASAIDNLNNIVEAANNNSEQVLTADIIHATALLNANVGLLNTAPVNNEQVVIDAVNALNVVLNEPTSTTADILAATDTFNTVVGEAKDSRIDATEAANTALGATDPVGNETVVTDAVTALNQVLNDPASTTAEILAATDTFNTVVGEAKDSRNDAKDAVNTALASTDPVGNETAVTDAVTALNEVLNNPASTTAEILAATDTFNTVVGEAKDSRNDAKDAADTALAATDPVGNEQVVTDAVTALNEVLNNPASTTAEILAATDTFNTVVGEAKDSRNDATDAADTALASTDPVGNETDVTNAVTALNEVLNNPASTTAEILAETDTFNTVVGEAKDSRNDAKDAADTAFAATDPVGNEQVVTDAVTALNEVLNNPASTTADILAATETFKDVVNQAKDSRNDAVDEAETLITNIDSISKRPGVKEKLDELQKTLDDAASGSENVLTADIKDTVQELREISENVQNVLDDANNHLTEDFANPVNKEPGVKDATDKLKDLVNDPTASIDDVQKAIDAMDTVIEQAKVERNQAIKDAENALKKYGNTGELGNLIQ